MIQFGVALPMTLNIPFRVIGAAALRAYADGTGDIPVALTGGDRIAYLLLWPHARPWRAARPSRCCARCPTPARSRISCAGALGAAAPTTSPETSDDSGATSHPAMRRRRPRHAAAAA